jgi:hypothetical protein
VREHARGGPFAGIALIQRFRWINYPFGALILFACRWPKLDRGG